MPSEDRYQLHTAEARSVAVSAPQAALVVQRQLSFYFDRQLWPVVGRASSIDLTDIVALAIVPRVGGAMTFRTLRHSKLSR
jgi:hypothetical protein